MLRLITMNGKQTSSSFAPVDTERLMDLHQGVAYVRFDASVASEQAAPLLAIYQGPQPIVRQGLQSVADLLRLNPKGHIVVISLRASDSPEEVASQ